MISDQSAGYQIRHCSLDGAENEPNRCRSPIHSEQSQTGQNPIRIQGVDVQGHVGTQKKVARGQNCGRRGKQQRAVRGELKGDQWVNRGDQWW